MDCSAALKQKLRQRQTDRLPARLHDSSSSSDSSSRTHSCCRASEQLACPCPSSSPLPTGRDQAHSRPTGCLLHPAARPACLPGGSGACGPQRAFPPPGRRRATTSCAPVAAAALSVAAPGADMVADAAASPQPPGSTALAPFTQPSPEPRGDAAADTAAAAAGDDGADDDSSPQHAAPQAGLLLGSSKQQPLVQVPKVRGRGGGVLLVGARMCSAMLAAPNRLLSQVLLPCLLLLAGPGDGSTGTRHCRGVRVR